mmetsp:Transcript_3527/g.5197  ORF Transcript_3527/g.5197 Transcript_3527/m.5197 type:complete len:236 (+) Transcript_3527:95-802(+)
MLLVRLVRGVRYLMTSLFCVWKTGGTTTSLSRGSMQGLVSAHLSTSSFCTLTQFDRFHLTQSNVLKSMTQMHLRHCVFPKNYGALSMQFMRKGYSKKTYLPLRALLMRLIKSVNVSTLERRLVLFACTPWPKCFYLFFHLSVSQSFLPPCSQPLKLTLRTFSPTPEDFLKNFLPFITMFLSTSFHSFAKLFFTETATIFRQQKLQEFVAIASCLQWAKAVKSSHPRQCNEEMGCN